MTIPPAVDREAGKPLAALHDMDAEQRLIGLALEHNDVVQLVAGIQPTHFYEPLHQRLWAFFEKKSAAGVVFDPVTVHDAFKDGDPAYQELGAIRYLADLVDHNPPKTAAPEYARIIVERATRRELVEISALIAEKARDPSEPLADVVAKSERLIGEIARGSEPGDVNLVDANTSAQYTLAEMRQEAADGRPKGLMTGLRCIDRRLRGLRPGHLIVIAGRPSMGKSGLARQIAHGAARRNKEHLFPFFCLEMHRREMDERTLSELTFRDGQPIRYHDMNPEKFTPMDWDILERAARRVPDNLILDDTASLSVDYVRRRAWALKRKGPIGAIFIDYLQIMKRPASNGRNDAAVIGEMTTALKVLARELQCAVVLLSQINRGVESRDDKRPQLSDLKESGSIEQDANVVLFPFREVYYLERAEPKQGSAEYAKWEEQVEILRRRMDVLCAKNRGGAVGTDTQEYHAEYDAVTDIREEGR